MTQRRAFTDMLKNIALEEDSGERVGPELSVRRWLGRTSEGYRKDGTKKSSTDVSLAQD